MLENHTICWVCCTTSQSVLKLYGACYNIYKNRWCIQIEVKWYRRSFYILSCLFNTNFRCCCFLFCFFFFLSSLLFIFLVSFPFLRLQSLFISCSFPFLLLLGAPLWAQYQFEQLAMCYIYMNSKNKARKNIVCKKKSESNERNVEKKRRKN